MYPPHQPGSAVAAPQVVFAVDDDAADRVLFAQRFAPDGSGHPCRFFSRGEDLIDALLDVLRGSPAPLACFVDIKMSGMSGFDVLRWIRCQDSLDVVPVIMLSSLDDPRTLHEACGVGAQCYVKKFPSAAELAAILTEARRYSADRSTPAAFPLSCNLLLDVAGAVTPEAGRSPSGAAAAPHRTAPASVAPSTR